MSARVHVGASSPPAEPPAPEQPAQPARPPSFIAQPAPLPAGAADHETRADWQRELFDPAFIIQRWRLVIFTFPVLLIFIGLRWTEWNGKAFAAPLDYTLVAPATTSVIFVCATMLSNVVSDYKEAEKIPAEISGYLQTLLSASVQQAAQRDSGGGGGAHGAAAEGGEAGAGAALRHVEELMLCVVDFLDQRRHYNVALNDFLAAENALCAQLKAWGRHDLEHVDHVLTETRKKLCRMHDLSRTNVILPLYTLIDALTLMFMSVLICADYYYDRTGYATIVVLGGLVIYMNLLNRSLDDPFTYPRGFHRDCYKLGKARRLTVREAWLFGPSIDFLCLTVDFGGILKRRLAERGLEALASTPKATASEDSAAA